MSDDRDRERLPPPPIDPLPDVAWARLERAVLSELDLPETRAIHVARARWPMVAVIGGALAAAAVVALVLGGGDRPAPSTAALPSADLPSRVVTGGSATEVSFGDAQITVAPASAIVLDGTADLGVLAVIERGSAAFVVAPRRARPPFSVQAGAVGVRVIGTELSVARIGMDDATVDVREGVVEVIHRGHSVDVHAGEHWSSVATATTTAASGATVAPAIATAEAGSLAPTTATTGTARPTAVPSTAHATHHSPDPRDLPAPVATPTEQERFEAAARLEVRDPTAALALYRELARGKTAWAGNALYALGRLSYDRGEFGAARMALTAYLHRFPRGANVADASGLLDHLQGASP